MPGEPGICKRGDETVADENLNLLELQLGWVRDVLDVYQNMGRIGDDAYKPRSGSAKEIKNWVEEKTDNKELFFKTMVPKALDILAKIQPPEENSVLEHEKKPIAELKTLLSLALEKAKNVEA